MIAKVSVIVRIAEERTVLSLPGVSRRRVGSVWLLALLMLGVLVSSLPSQSLASDEVVTFANPVHKEMYERILKEYRCLKCQNQNLWDSNAGLAGDLRREIRGQIEAGESKEEIDNYLVSRYGEFVLYRPRFNAKTAILWIAPFALLLIGLVALIVMARNKASQARQPDRAKRFSGAAELAPPDRLAKARELLGD